MKNRFIAKTTSKNKKLKRYFLFFMFITGIYFSYKYLESRNIELKDKEFVNLLIDNSFKYNEADFIEKIANKTYEISNPVKLLSKEYNKYLDITETAPVIKEEIKPKIYLYNTHQTEEYQTSELLEFTIKTKASFPIGTNSNSTPLLFAYANCFSDGSAQNIISTPLDLFKEITK
jgi:hypothetical protein